MLCGWYTVDGFFFSLFVLRVSFKVRAVDCWDVLGFAVYCNFEAIRLLRIIIIIYITEDKKKVNYYTRGYVGPRAIQLATRRRSIKTEAKS